MPKQLAVIIGHCAVSNAVNLRVGFLPVSAAQMLKWVLNRQPRHQHFCW